MTSRIGYYNKDQGKTLFPMLQKNAFDKKSGGVEERSLMDTERICELLIVLLYIIKMIFH